jgi:NTE family protein
MEGTLIPPRRICLSGGGIRAVSFIGALEVLDEHGLLKAVQEYVGVSAGAFMGFCMCLGYSLNDLKRLCLAFDFTLIRTLEPESALLFMESYGLDEGDKLMKFYETILKQKGYTTELTFAELAARGPGLRCYATDLNICEAREFSAAITPTVRLVDALRATMGLTFFYTPVVDPHTGHLLTDGGVMNNYPLGFLTPDEQKHSLGFTFSHTHVQDKEVTDFFGFIQQMFGCIYLARDKQMTSLMRDKTIFLPNGDYPSWNFEATKEDRQRLIDQAAAATRSFLSTKPQKGLRRFSV